MVSLGRRIYYLGMDAGIIGKNPFARRGVFKNDKGSAPNSCVSALSGLRFFYNHVTQQQICIEYSLSRKVQKLPTVLAQEDIWSIINATDNLKHRLLQMTTYSVGLRAFEVRVLMPKHTESKKIPSGSIENIEIGQS